MQPFSANVRPDIYARKCAEKNDKQFPLPQSRFGSWPNNQQLNLILKIASKVSITWLDVHIQYAGMTVADESSGAEFRSLNGH